MNVLTKVRRHIRSSAPNYRLETGFSMLEAVVVVGVLLALAVGGFFAYGPVVENAKISKVRSAASEVHTGVLVASMDGNSDTTPEKVISDWNTNVSKIKVELVDSQGGNGDFCVAATNVASPHITHQTGSCVPGSGTPSDGSSNPDTDGDGIPDSTDPDIDGDGIPNESDSTPNGETVASPGSETGGSTTPVSTRCTNLSVQAEAACWMEIVVAEEERWINANNGYFGLSNYPAYYADVPYTGNEFDDMPLMRQEWQSAEAYADTPEYSWSEALLNVIDRDGQLWKDKLYREYNGPNPTSRDGIYDSGQNLNFNCNYIGAVDMISDVCKVGGVSATKYRTVLADHDSAAEADVRKILNAQYEYSKTGSKIFYGGNTTPTDVKSWAGTGYDAKVYNFQNTSPTSAQNITTHIQVTAPNGDVYHAQLSRWTGAEPAATLDQTNIHVYRHTSAHVAEVCSRPFENKAGQAGDRSYCQMQGYANFKAA